MDPSLNLFILKLSEQYNNYKKAYKFPSKYKSNNIFKTRIN